MITSKLNENHFASPAAHTWKSDNASKVRGLMGIHTRTDSEVDVYFSRILWTRFSRLIQSKASEASEEHTNMAEAQLQLSTKFSLKAKTYISLSCTVLKPILFEFIKIISVNQAIRIITNPTVIDTFNLTCFVLYDRNWQILQSDTQIGLSVFD